MRKGAAELVGVNWSGGPRRPFIAAVRRWCRRSKSVEAGDIYWPHGMGGGMGGRAGDETKRGGIMAVWLALRDEMR